MHSHLLQTDSSDTVNDIRNKKKNASESFGLELDHIYLPSPAAWTTWVERCNIHHDRFAEHSIFMHTIGYKLHMHSPRVADMVSCNSYHLALEQGAACVLARMKSKKNIRVIAEVKVSYS